MGDDIKGKRVVITAAATGIGRVTAESFLAAGARVHVCDIDEPRLRAFEAARPASSASRGARPTPRRNGRSSA
jgi:NAD(P)-dependent dehydrogenase (short-subunit alcohol dehydrogenase family)